MISLWLALQLAACTFSVQNTGPTYVGQDYARERLLRIADRPSDEGTREAVRRWAQHPDWPEAERAVFAALPGYADPLVAHFDRLSSEQQSAVIAHLGSKNSSAASEIVVQLTKQSGRSEDAIAALAGREDRYSVEGLLAIASDAREPEAVRVDAVKGMKGFDDYGALEGLIALATNRAQPTALREAAVVSLSPLVDNKARLAMLALVRGEDSSVAAFALAGFGAPQNDAEQTEFLAATQRSVSSAAAVRALDQSKTLADVVVARFRTMVDPASTPSDPGLRAGRVAAGTALTGRGDAAGGPALVQALDDATLRGAAFDALDRWSVEALATLRQVGPNRATPEARAEVARLLARYGAPSDEAMVGALAAPAEKSTLLAELKYAPYALFPDGRVRYTPAATDAAPVEHTLLEAMRAGRTLRATPNDPHLAYIGAARAYLAGARTKADRDALDAAAAAARATFAAWMRDDLAPDNWQQRELAKTAHEHVAAALAPLPLALSAPPLAGIPALRVGGATGCTGGPRTEREPLPDGVYEYTVRVQNPRKAQLQRTVDAWPLDQRTTTSCEMVCSCYTPGQGSWNSTFSCEYNGSVAGSCNCSRNFTTSETPAFREARLAYEREPQWIDQALTVPLKRERITEVTKEQCAGNLVISVGAATHTGALRYTGEARKWVIQGTAQPVDENRRPMDRVSKTLDEGVSDDRAQQRVAGVRAALAGYAPTVAMVRTMYADAVKPAVTAGDLRSARDALVWAEPNLVATNGAELAAFRQRWFSDGPGAFPAAWR